MAAELRQILVELGLEQYFPTACMLDFGTGNHSATSQRFNLPPSISVSDIAGSYNEKSREDSYSGQIIDLCQQH